MKLNEARYFRQPRANTRKQIAKTRLFPNIPGLSLRSISSSEDQLSPSTYSRNANRWRNRINTLNRDHKSKEIASISYSRDLEDTKTLYQLNNRTLRDIFAETDPEREIVDTHSKCMNFIPEIAQNIKTDVLLEPKLNAYKQNKLSQKEIRTDNYRSKSKHSNENQSFDSNRSFWWPYRGIRKILDFFGQLLIKREPGNHGNERKRKKKLPKRNILSNRKPTDDQVFSDFAKQIMSTRDKRLRAALWEHEIRTRKLEEENRRYKKILQEKLEKRQMSSPLH